MLDLDQTAGRTDTDSFADFAYCLLHDLSAPIRQTKGFAALAVRDAGGVLPPDQGRRLGQISWAAARGEVLLDSLHRASAALGKPLSLEVCDTGELLAQATAIAAAASLRGDFKYEQGALGSVKTDRQVFTASLEAVLGCTFNCAADPARPMARIECVPSDDAWVLLISHHPGQPSPPRLALSRQLLKRLGGDIVRHDQDDGRSLEIRLPLEACVR